MNKNEPKCCDPFGKCFARNEGKCGILTGQVKPPCKFKKEKALWTNGKFYPYQPAAAYNKEILPKKERR